MTEATAIDLEASWLNILVGRFKIEVAEDRHAALFCSLARYAESLGETPERLLYRAHNRLLTPDHWAQVIHLATNHETRFYRNKAVVELVAQYATEFPRPRILSVGCSTGEEPYTLAVELGKRSLANYHVHATDVSLPCIEFAREGRYRDNELISDRFAKRDGNGGMQFFGWLKDFVTYEQHNVLSERPISFASPTIILTQNMLIYYRQETRFRILENLALMLPQGGYLITGPAEEAHWKPDDLERLPVAAATVFRKK